ncbi:MAG: DUF1456 family protein [Thermodesulfovibrionales bacterium]|jgi:uncharacterized protein YehS (DUF1456 family)
MTNNDIMRRLRYALDLNDSTITEIFGLSGLEIDQAQLSGLLKRDDEEGFTACSKDSLKHFLDGLIIYKRGRKEDKPDQPGKTDSSLTNNVILKKIRIALELYENDMIEMLKLGGMAISKAELTALFRKKGHKNYKDCGDQLLRNFLKGLTLRYRSASPEA